MPRCVLPADKIVLHGIRRFRFGGPLRRQMLPQLDQRLHPEPRPRDRLGASGPELLCAPFPQQCSQHVHWSYEQAGSCLLISRWLADATGDVGSTAYCSSKCCLGQCELQSSTGKYSCIDPPVCAPTSYPCPPFAAMSARYRCRTHHTMFIHKRFPSVPSYGIHSGSHVGMVARHGSFAVGVDGQHASAQTVSSPPHRRSGCAELLQRRVLRGRPQRLRHGLRQWWRHVLPGRIGGAMRRPLLRGRLRLQLHHGSIRLLCALVLRPGATCVNGAWREDFKPKQCTHALLIGSLLLGSAPALPLQGDLPELANCEDSHSEICVRSRSSGNRLLWR